MQLPTNIPMYELVSIVLRNRHFYSKINSVIILAIDYAELHKRTDLSNVGIGKPQICYILTDRESVSIWTKAGLPF